MRIHEGVSLVEQILTPEFKGKLETLAALKEEDIKITERGFNFTFENSLQANYCQVIKYNNQIILEFRKRTDNLLQGKMDQLVYEKVIKPQEIYDIFEDVTNIYLSYI